MIGPSITGILIAAFGGDGRLRAGGGRLVHRARALQPPAALGDEPRPRRAARLAQLVEGLSFVGAQLRVREPHRLALFNALFGLSYITLLPIFADTYFGIGSTGYGLLSAAHGAGSMVGTLIVATDRPASSCAPGHAHADLRDGHGAGVDAVLAVAGHGLRDRDARAGGLLQHVLSDAREHDLQQEVPDHLRGRVMSLYSLCWNLLPLGGLLAGALAAAVDARFAVLMGGALVAANALVLFTSRRLRAIG